MSAHTPGPWREGPTEGIGQRGKLIVVDANGVKIADCEATRDDARLVFARPYSEDIANVHLIATAPELLAELKTLVAEIERLHLPVPFARLAIATGLIAKAEGR